MANSQLDTVLRVESDREQHALGQFRDAQQALKEQQNKLAQLQQYRVDYIENIKRNANQGLGSTEYQQHLSFVGKLDLACEQQLKVISKASLTADQYKREWIVKQRRKKAIEALIEKRVQQASLLERRREQQAMDEFASQQFIRKRLAL